MRLPSVALPYELNPDESQWLSQGMKFFQDPRPWKAVDPGTSGPLNSYPISILLWLGFKPNYIVVHVLATVLVCLQVLLSCLIFLRLGSQIAAISGAISMVLLYGATINSNFLHYSSELFPVLLLILVFFGFLVWAQNSPSRSESHCQPLLLFSCGLALGAAPWFKIQASPIVAALGLIVFAASLFAGGRSLSIRQRTMQATALCCGTLLPTIVMLAVVIKCGSLRDFWNSYILESLIWAGPLTLRQLINHCAHIFTQPHGQQLLSVLGFAPVLFLLGVLTSKAPRVQMVAHRWIFAGILAYTGAALFAVCRPAIIFDHHAQFLFFPVICLAVALASPNTAWSSGKQSGSRQLYTTLFSIILLVGLAVFSAYQARSSQSFYATYPLPKTNERIADRIGAIQKTRPVKSLAIWGWSPGVYVLIGIPPATRDAVAAFVITKGPLRPYFRKRFVADLRDSMPDLFIDSVTSNVPTLNWTTDDGYESDEDLKKFIQNNYTLIAEVTLVRDARPVRFFAKRAHDSNN